MTFTPWITFILGYIGRWARFYPFWPPFCPLLPLKQGKFVWYIKSYHLHISPTSNVTFSLKITFILGFIGRWTRFYRFWPSFLPPRAKNPIPDYRDSFRITNRGSLDEIYFNTVVKLARKKWCHRITNRGRFGITNRGSFVDYILGQAGITIRSSFVDYILGKASITNRGRLNDYILGQNRLQRGVGITYRGKKITKWSRDYKSG